MLRVSFLTTSNHTQLLSWPSFCLDLLRSADYTGRIAKWGTILGTFDINYMPHTSVKGQVLTDLVVEFAETPLEERVEKQNMDGKSVGAISLQEPLS